MQSVLGLSVTSTSVGWVLLDGHGRDATVLDHDAFDIQPGVHGADVDASPHTAAARGAQAIAAASGHKVGSVHVTWTEGVEAGAAALLKSLADLGFDNVQAVPVRRAAQSWGIETGRESEHAKTGLCILEPDVATIMIIATGAGSVRTAIMDNRDSAEDLVELLRTVFRRDGWLPESLYLVGAHADLDEVTQPITDALPIPVSDSVDTQLALARGAALATIDNVDSDSVHAAEEPLEKPWRITRPKKPTAPETQQPVVESAVTQVIATPSVDSPKRERPLLLAHAKKLTLGAAAVAIFGAALSLAAGSALNVETNTAQAADTTDSGASETSASVHPVPVAPAPVLQPLAAAPPAVPPPAPETLSSPAQPIAVSTPEPAAVPVPHLTEATAPTTSVPVAAPVAPSLPAASLDAPVATSPPEAAALAAPVAPPPEATPLGVPPAVGPPAAVAPAPAVVPPAAVAPAPAVVPPAAVAPAPAAPVVPPTPADGSQPPPSDPIQQALSPLFSGLP